MYKYNYNVKMFLLVIICLINLSLTAIEFCEKSEFYLHDEGTNHLGCNRCINSCDCDGKRTCSIFQWCQGVSRAKNKDYYYNEDLSNSECDPQSPLKDFYCNSNRICDSKGKCIDPIK